jgi:N4-gp56 family major capsid protein
MAGSATGNNTAGLLGAFHEKRLIEVLDANVVYDQLAEKKVLPVSNGVTITFHTINKLGRGSKITEGVQPDTTFLTAGTKSATLIQFGDVTAFTDMMYKASVADMHMIAAERLGEAAAITRDEYIQDRLYSEVALDVASKLYYHEGPLGWKDYNVGLSTFYNGIKGGLSLYALSTDSRTKITAAQIIGLSTAVTYPGPEAVAGSMKMTLKQIRKVVTTLRERNVKPAIGTDYAMVTRPTIVDSISSDPEFIEWNRYNNADKMFNFEVGRIEGCRVIQTTNQIYGNYKLASTLTGYVSTFLGAGAFAVTEFSGDTGIHMYSVGFENKDSSNVLQQNAYHGYKWTGAAKVLDSDCGIGLVTFNG